MQPKTLLSNCLHIVILAVLSLCYKTATCQETLSFLERYNVSYITVKDGLSHDFVDDIYKDSRGFMWISTGGGGLSRYDGYEFINFSPNSSRNKIKSCVVKNVVEDAFGRIWSASDGGLDVISLDLLKNVVPNDKTGKLKELLTKSIYSVATDSLQRVWVNVERNVYRLSFDKNGDVIEIAQFTLPRDVFNGVVIKDVEGNGNVWVGYNGAIYRLSGGKQLKSEMVSLTLRFEGVDYFSDIELKDNEVWISTNNGLYRYNRQENRVKHYVYDANDNHSLSQNFLTHLAVTQDNRLIVTSLRGANVYNPISDNFERLGDESGRFNSIFFNMVYVDGPVVWIATEGCGINKLVPRQLYVRNFVHEANRPASLSSFPVNAILDDPNGYIWVGNVEGGLNRKVKGSDYFDHFTVQTGVLSHNSVSALALGGADDLWVGTWGGGIDVLNRKNPQQSHRLNVSGLPPYIGVLAYDKINNAMWIGSNTGLYLYDIATQTLKRPLGTKQSDMIKGCVGSLVDKDGNLWVGCLDGICVVNLKKKRADGTFEYRHLKYKLDNPDSKIVEHITCICQASDGTIWLGSNGYGLYRRVVKNSKETFVGYDTQKGLCNNTVKGVLEDADGAIWVATNNGLARLDVATGRFGIYTLQDGLISDQFYWNAYCRTSEGKLMFGTTQGLVALDSRAVAQRPSVNSHVVFTRLIVGNVEAFAGDGVIDKDISALDVVRIHEREKSFSIEFSALDYTQNDASYYSYRLVGFDEEWVRVGDNRRFVSYTNLSPGTYTLQVRYEPDGDVNNAQIAEIRVVIVPYFYKTPWFMLIMACLIVGLFFGVHRWRVRSLERQKAVLQAEVDKRTSQLETQKHLAEDRALELADQNQRLVEKNEEISQQKAQLTEMNHRVQELTVDRISFFTNITHEFRTPITLIMGPIQRALKLSYNPQVLELLRIVDHNSKYLLTLVNQLMDFRKIESGKIEIRRSSHNIISFIDGLFEPFVAMAQERGIKLNKITHFSQEEISYDEEALRKVLTNLLSNALKFTPDNREITLYAALMPTCVLNGENTLYFCVRDTGSGISENEIDKVFERFYQGKEDMKYPVMGTGGSGIGLYLCRSIVEIYGGRIWAKNNPGDGCSFRVLLPVDKNVTEATDEEPGGENIVTQVDSVALQAGEARRLTILVVEDNKDMRLFINSILREKYDVLEAENGKQALDVLAEHNIDFIISDLMMPVMDGMELYNHVKENFMTSHIPFLMLTAKTDVETRLESYRRGVDEYLLKPFDDALLQARIEGILHNRSHYQRKFSLDMNVEDLNIEGESRDKKFMDQVMEVIKNNYKNSYFDVGDFAESLGVSRSLLNKKLQSLIGQSAGQFVRTYRMNIAHELILKNRRTKAMNISEIAYEVGFNDAKYFTRCFSKQFNVPPSTLLNGEDEEKPSEN